MKKKYVNKNNLIDYIILLFVIVILAFKDYRNLNIIISLFVFIMVIVLKIKNYKILIDKKDIKFVINKIVFIAFCFITSFFSVNEENSLSIVYTIILRLINCITILIYIDNENKLQKFSKYIMVASIILCVRMIIVVPVSAWGNERVGTYLAHDQENSYGNTGITYVLGFAISILLVNDKVIKNSKIRYLIIILFSIFSLLSGSKKQVILLIVSIFILLYFKSTNIIKFIKNFFIALFVILVSGIAIFFNQTLYNSIGTRLISFANYFIGEDVKDTDASTLSRVYYIDEAKRVFKENPILGVGIDGFRYLNTYEFCWAENNFYELLADTGIIGFLIYYYIYFYILIKVLRRRKRKSANDIAIIILMACYLIIDYTMVTYSTAILQFYFAYIYCINKIEENNVIDHKRGDGRDG